MTETKFINKSATEQLEQLNWTSATEQIDAIYVKKLSDVGIT